MMPHQKWFSLCCVIRRTKHGTNKRRRVRGTAASAVAFPDSFERRSRRADVIARPPIERASDSLDLQKPGNESAGLGGFAGVAREQVEGQ
jgi:hypothetical protein